MKTLLISIFTLFLFTASYAQKKVVEDSIPVSGVCEMCKERIDSSLDMKGVKIAEWDMSNKTLFIAYRQDKISEEQIHKAIVATGHDTDQMKADDEVYAELPFCCLHRDHDPHDKHKKDKKHDDGDHNKNHQK